MDYYTGINNLDKVVFYCDILYKNGKEEAADEIFKKYIDENKDRLNDIENLNYLFIDNFLAYIYYNGMYVSKDLNKSFQYYKKAADQGSYIAQFNLGEMYNGGEGVKKDNKLSFDYYKKAADQGHTDALNRIGHMYYFGQGVEKKYSKALEYFKKAADQGHIVSQFNVGFMYYNGIGVQKNNLEALKYLKVAAEKGNKEAETFINKIDNNMELEKKFISSASEGGKSK